MLGDDGMPAFLPDGLTIAFTSNRAQNAEIWTMRPGGSRHRILLRHPGDDLGPAWSPDGDQAAS